MEWPAEIIYSALEKVRKQETLFINTAKSAANIMVATYKQNNVARGKYVPFSMMLTVSPCPGHTGNYTPVPGRRVGRTQMEESRR